jgi:hypothetical protein
MWIIDDVMLYGLRSGLMTNFDGPHSVSLNFGEDEKLGVEMRYA